ncbi:DUF4127 family protein [Oceanobacillus sp. Castelsardo]|uniref:DUF4127 family protein n=1 Tax=Oceanobacillus sp. Castelsardo TaxID=1851204 RepID=UPI0008397C08|nr:DUF4127 family protein [Oceanobacillus sp. Castelsardo]
MFKKQRVYSLLLAFLILGIVWVSYNVISYQENSKSTQAKENDISIRPRLLYVPLDDRPVSTEVPKQLGNITGMELVLPPNEWIGHFETPGNTKALSHWVLEQAENVDGFVLSSDMLVYGGLVASRTGNLSQEDAMKNLLLLKTIKKLFPEKPIYVYSSLLRLAPTARDESYMEAYTNIRKWAIAKGTDGKEDEASRLENELDSEFLAHYKDIRKRNTIINETLISFVKEGTIDYLIYGQDDAAKFGLHKQEQESLKNSITENIKQNVSLLSGTDEMASLLISRFAVEVYNVTPNIQVVYDSPLAPSWIPPMEYVEMKENITEHIRAIGGRMTENSTEADFYYFVKTKYTPESRSFVHKMKEYTNEEKPIAIVDTAIINKASSMFVEDILHNVDMGSISAYSGWNTAGNSIGLSLSTAIMREVYLETTDDKTMEQKVEQTKHHAELVFRSFLIDYGYKTNAYTWLSEEIKENGDDPLALGDATKKYEAQVQDILEKEAAFIFKKAFEEKHFYLSRNHKASIIIDKLSPFSATLPWNRLFEVDINPSFIIKEP